MRKEGTQYGWNRLHKKKRGKIEAITLKKGYNSLIAVNNIQCSTVFELKNFKQEITWLYLHFRNFTLIDSVENGW